MSGGDTSIEEKRVYSDRTGAATVLVASGVGLVAVSLSADLVGEYGIEHRGDVRDVAADGRVALADDEDVHVDAEPTGFGPAVAVGVDGETVYAADAEGTVARLDGEAGEGDAGGDREAWTTLGEVTGPRRFDGSLLAAAAGVHRVGDDVAYAGLDDALDVAAAVPLAATGDGLYRLGNGWIDERSGTFDVVASDGIRTHAVGRPAGGDEERGDGDGDDGGDGDERVSTASEAFARIAPDEWVGVEVPTDDPLADVTYTSEAVVAVTETGTLLADASEGWRTFELGVRDVRAAAVSPYSQ